MLGCWTMGCLILGKREYYCHFLRIMRHITVMPVVAKVFRRIIYEQLYLYKTMNSFLTCYQSCFLPCIPRLRRGGLGEGWGGGGCAPPPPSWDDLRFSNTTGVLQKKTMWYIGVEVELETSKLRPRKNPGSASVTALMKLLIVGIWILIVVFRRIIYVQLYLYKTMNSFLTCYQSCFLPSTPRLRL